MGHGGSLKPPIEAVNASLSLFDQAPFMSPDNNGTAIYNATTPRATGMAPAGFVYVPKACRAVGAACKLHFSFHGCGVNEYYDEAVHHLSFQRWAEANGRRPPSHPDLLFIPTCTNEIIDFSGIHCHRVHPPPFPVCLRFRRFRSV